MAKNEDVKVVTAVVVPEEWERRVDEDIEQARRLEVTTMEQYKATEALQEAIVIRQRQWKDFMSDSIAKAHQAHKAAVATFKRLDDRYEAAKTAIARARGAFVDRQAKLRRVIAEQIAEDEQTRLCEAVTARQEDIVRAEVSGDVVMAERLRASPVLLPPSEMVPVEALPEVPTKNVVQPWKFEVTDEDKVPRKFCSPDDKKIRALIKALGGDAAAQLPGVRVYQDLPQPRVTVRRA